MEKPRGKIFPGRKINATIVAHLTVFLGEKQVEAYKYEAIVIAKSDEELGVEAKQQRKSIPPSIMNNNSNNKTENLIIDI